MFFNALLFLSMNANGLCKWSAGLKVMNFQFCTEPIRLFNITNFPSIVKDELAVLQRRTAVEIPAETRITFTFCCTPFLGLIFHIFFLNQLLKLEDILRNESHFHKTHRLSQILYIFYFSRSQPKL